MTTVDEWVWLEYPETRGRQRFAAAAADVWRQKGWVDTDPPNEPDPTREPAEQPNNQTTAEPADRVDQAPKTTSRKRGASTDQEH